MKKFQIMFMIAIIGVMFMAAQCDNNSSRIEAQKQEVLKKEADAQTGMPNVHNFTLKKQMKMIIEACDQENLVCYAYIVPEMTGKPSFLCKCIGYGLPYATQYTNPQVDTYYTSRLSAHVTMPQADPDGLYKPASADGTWIMAINPKDNSIHVLYVEPKVLISPFPLN